MKKVILLAAAFLVYPLVHAQFYQGYGNNGYNYGYNRAGYYDGVAASGAAMSAAGLQAVTARRGIEAQKRADFNELNMRRELAGLKPISWEKYNGEEEKPKVKSATGDSSGKTKEGLRTTR